jgi:hypothetical protein
MEAAENKRVFSMLGEEKLNKKSFKLAVSSQEDKDDEDKESNMVVVKHSSQDQP